MFEVPYAAAHLNAYQPFMQSRFQQRESERVVIDLVTPPRPATTQQSYQDAPKQTPTPSRDCAGLNQRPFQKKKLGKDSSRVKMSLKNITKTMPLKAGSAQLLKRNVLLPYSYAGPSFPTRLAVEVPIRESATAGNVNQATSRPRVFQQPGDQQNLGPISRLHQYSFPLPRPRQDENLQCNVGLIQSATSSTCAPPGLIQPHAADDPSRVGSANMTGTFAAPSAFYYGYYAYPPAHFLGPAPPSVAENHQQLFHYPYAAPHGPYQYHSSQHALQVRPTTTSSTASMFQVGSMTTIVDRKTSITSQATDMSAALAGRQVPHH
ncbi:hypothetical protein QFC24_004568 [Naganishia onofrii]|uniref:Uncharacterized protein n=1 Tax=Naganishia onofrii TaxID=1851511 RepID=A0ACC2XEF1_9TREE|nr:hypothetical protein QFC24_004568 [Naganishia onofrii]